MYGIVQVQVRFFISGVLNAAENIYQSAEIYNSASPRPSLKKLSQIDHENLLFRIYFVQCTRKRPTKISTMTQWLLDFRLKVC